MKIESAIDPRHRSFINGSGGTADVEESSLVLLQRAVIVLAVSFAEQYQPARRYDPHRRLDTATTEPPVNNEDIKASTKPQGRLDIRVMCDRRDEFCQPFGWPVEWLAREMHARRIGPRSDPGIPRRVMIHPIPVKIRSASRQPAGVPDRTRTQAPLKHANGRPRKGRLDVLDFLPRLARPAERPPDGEIGI